jgi:ATP-dependent DNA ligase
MAPANVPIPREAIRARLPDRLSPQLVTLVHEPPVMPDEWIWEAKYDYRG